MREVKLVKFDDDEDEDNPRPGIQEIVVLDGRDEGPDDRDKGGGTSLGLDPTNLFARMPGNMIHLVMVVVQMIV